MNPWYQLPNADELISEYSHGLRDGKQLVQWVRSNPHGILGQWWELPGFHYPKSSRPYNLGVKVELYKSRLHLIGPKWVDSHRYYMIVWEVDDDDYR